MYVLDVFHRGYHVLITPAGCTVLLGEGIQFRTASVRGPAGGPPAEYRHLADAAIEAWQAAARSGIPCGRARPVYGQRQPPPEKRFNWRELPPKLHPFAGA